MTKTRFENLSENEKQVLNDLTIGYGKLTNLSLATGIDSQTLRNVRKNGYGEVATIKLMRKKIFTKAKVEA